MLLLFLVLGTCLAPVRAQVNELFINFNINLLTFSGSASAKTTDLLISKKLNYSSTEKLYGKRFSPGAGISLHYSRTFGSNHLGGISVGYEFMKSRTDINRAIIFYDNGKIDTSDASGKALFRVQNITMRPFLGHRWTIGRGSLDILGGFDVSAMLSPYSDLRVMSSSTLYKATRKVTTIDLDIRPTVRIDLKYQSFGLFLDYSHGLRNYSQKFILGNSLIAKSRLLRLGISYRFYKKDFRIIPELSPEEQRVRKVKIHRQRRR